MDSTVKFQSPDAVEAAFYSAFAAIDLVSMEQVWAQTGTVICVHPGGEALIGKTEAMRSWAEIFSGAAPPRIRFRLLSRIESPDLNVHLVEETIHAGGDPKAPPHSVISTNVYTREGDGWRMQVHHASLPMMARRGAASGERQLH